MIHAVVAKIDHDFILHRLFHICMYVCMYVDNDNYYRRVLVSE